MFYYLCKRCNHMAKQKIEMKRHLDKNKKCDIVNKNDEYSENELYNLSLIKHDIISKNSDDDDDKKDDKKDNYCEKCDKFFYNKSNLKKHLKKNICENKDIINTIQNIGIQNNIINNNQKIINININYPKGFDEEWDVSKIDDIKKGEILLSNSKFSKTLENILKNDVNLNVILNSDNDIGIVYKNQKNKYEPMSNKEIIELSMEKIYKNLKDFYQEIINNNNNDLSEAALKNELIELEKKYSRFFRLEEAQNIVKNSFTNIYNNRKNDAELKYFELLLDDESLKKDSY